MVAHDLKNPVCSVRDSIEVIGEYYVERPLDPTGLALVEGAAKSLRRMSTLIDSLLDYARGDKSQALCKPVDLDSVMKEVRFDLSSAIHKSGARVTAKDLPVVQGDPVGYRRVLQNLVANAIKFRGDEPSAVCVTASRRGSEWRVEVADNGIGIDSRDLVKIFEPFRRLHDRSRYDGSGLGLASCRRIIERLGGRIGVESAPGSGSKFWFTCPGA